MKLLSSPLPLAAAAVFLTAATAHADPPRLVLQNGRSIPLTAVSFQGTQYTVVGQADFFSEGQVIPLASVDHVYGDKPPEINRGVAVVLSGKASDAIKILEPVVAANGITSKIPGNFWMEAARALVVAYALNADTAKCNDLGKQISEATPAPGNDPIVALSRAIMLPATTRADDREQAFRDLTSDTFPADIGAYASFFRGNVLREAKKIPEALESYLMVTGLFPAGGMVINAAAEINAADLLSGMNRPDEAVALLKSAARDAGDTVLAAEANKRLESHK